MKQLLALITNKALIFNAFCLFFCACILSSCGSDPRFKGYTENENGLFYKLQEIGDGKRKPGIGDYLQLVITYKTEKDSVFMDSYSRNDLGTVILPFNHSSFSGSFEEGLSNMNEGDSMSFIVSSAPLFEKFFKAPLPVFLASGSLVKMDVKLKRILNRQEYEKELAHYQDIVEDRDIEEQRRLQQYLDTCGTEYTPLGNGIWYVPAKQGTGDLPERGNTVKINYKGYFLNGQLFESTYDRGLPLEFNYGEQGQVIAGLETAISLLKEGAKAKFIIPSHLAFGDSGSSTGIVPPYTTVIYEVELLTLTK
jgi:FKBP-type peptidyl-prolyl cis-trans isomerase FkpA